MPRRHFVNTTKREQAKGRLLDLLAEYSELVSSPSAQGGRTKSRKDYAEAYGQTLEDIRGRNVIAGSVATLE